MGIYVSAMVIVSVTCFLAETEPPKKDKAQFVGFGEGGGSVVIVQKIEKPDKSDDSEAEQRTNNKTVSPFEFDVNVVTEAKEYVLPAMFIQQATLSNPMLNAFSELKRRKRYFISFCKVYYHRKKVCVFINRRFPTVILRKPKLIKEVI